jgi:hypothetical protein
MRFSDDPLTTYSFVPEQYWLTSRYMDFTIVATDATRCRQFTPIGVRDQFVLRIGDPIAYKNSGTVPKRVSAITDVNFTYSSHTKILQGMPIFTNTWQLQGMHSISRSTSQNIATRIDTIIEHMHSVRKIASHPDVD